MHHLSVDVRGHAFPSNQVSKKVSLLPRLTHPSPGRRHSRPLKAHQNGTQGALRHSPHESNGNGTHPRGWKIPEEQRPPVAHDTEESKSVDVAKLPQHWREHQSASRCMRRVIEINALEPAMKQLAHQDLRNKTEEFKMRLAMGKDTLESLLPEAFAVVREASRRYINMRHFDTQLIGGMVLHEGTIAEMGTGEGKTLVATLPAYLNALTGKGVHIVTVNTYLASRDSSWMGRIFRALGLSVGVCLNHRLGPENQAAFDADITYVTSQHLAWIYLADNSDITELDKLTIRRPFNYAIVDEADSVLIDDAGTPLILSRFAPPQHQTPWRLAAQVCTKARWSRKVPIAPQYYSDMEHRRDGFEDYVLWDVEECRRDVYGKAEGPAHVSFNHASKEVEVTELGHQKIFEELVRLGYNFEHVKGRAPEPGDMWSGKDAIGPLVTSILRSQPYQENIDYIVRDGRIVILSPNTGRALDHSRWTDGMHQAVEAKEGLDPGTPDMAHARITYQVFFNFYAKLAGMTGTAKSAEVELHEQYKLPVQSVPPHRPSKRTDHPVEVFMDRCRGIWSKDLPAAWRQQILFDTRKDSRIFGLVIDSIKRQQPVLIGTNSVEESEDVEEMLRQYGIRTEVLNAKPEAAKREAAIIAQAGLPETRHTLYGRAMPAVTIATSMAGRGTDIRLGGDPKGIMHSALKGLFLPFMVKGLDASDIDPCPLKFWPSDHSLAKLKAHLPPELHTVLRSAAKVILPKYKDPADKLDLQAGAQLLEQAFSRAESQVNEFILLARRNYGSLDMVGRSQLFWELERFSAVDTSMFPEKEGVEDEVKGHIDRAALWMWIWFETYCSCLAAEARAAGGLRVIVTSLGHSWRILDQFRGRCGRQGDPGETYVVLNLFQNILLNSPIKEKQIDSLEKSGMSLEKAASAFEGTVGGEAVNSHMATSLAIGPYFHAHESRGRDYRLQTKEQDEVLGIMREQVFAFRRWIISASPAQLHGLIRTFCFDAAADLIAAHVDLNANPSTEQWNLVEILRQSWLTVNGDQAAVNEEEQNNALRVWVSDLFGSKMANDKDLAGLHDVAGKLRAALAGGNSVMKDMGDEALGDSPGVDLDFVKEQMQEAYSSFLSGIDDRFRSFNGRYRSRALSLVEFLACVFYVAWVGKRRAAVKRQLAFELSHVGVRFQDSFSQDQPLHGNGTVLDLEQLVQDWERKNLADSLHALWTHLLGCSEIANQTASFSFISHLRPIEEYRSLMTKAYMDLLDDHRVCSIQNMFAGPSLGLPRAPSKDQLRRLLSESTEEELLAKNRNDLNSSDLELPELSLAGRDARTRET